MGFDFFSKINCAIQEPRSDREFAQRAKLRGIARQMKNLIEREPDPNKQAHMKEFIGMPFPVKTLMGARTSLAYDELMETWERIERKSLPICRDCPVNLSGDALGCCGIIRYPISQAAEHWLMDRFKPGDSSYLIHHMKQANVDGRHLDDERREYAVNSPDAKISLLLPPGPAQKWVDGERITSSMILEYLLACQPVLHPGTALALLDEFGAVEMDEASKLMMMFSQITGYQEAKSPVEKLQFNLPDSPSDDSSIIEFKRFLKACYLSLRHEGQVHIDG